MPNAPSVHRQMNCMFRKRRRQALRRIQAFESSLHNELYGTVVRCAVVIQKCVRGYLTRKRTRELKKRIVLKRDCEIIKRSHPNANKDELELMFTSKLCELGLVGNDMLNFLLDEQSRKKRSASRKRSRVKAKEGPAAKVAKKA